MRFSPVLDASTCSLGDCLLIHDLRRPITYRDAGRGSKVRSWQAWVSSLLAKSDASDWVLMLHSHENDGNVILWTLRSVTQPQRLDFFLNL